MMHTPCETIKIGAPALFKAYYSGWGQASLGLPCRPPRHWLIPRQEAYAEGYAARSRSDREASEVGILSGGAEFRNTADC